MSNHQDNLEQFNDTFKEYHNKYPQVYETFVKLTHQTKGKGFKRFSARGLFQVMRWKMGGKIKTDGYKFNNNFTPYYVRLLEIEYPQFVGFYEKRKVNKPVLT
jgi:hypothetical protein